MSLSQEILQTDDVEKPTPDNLPEFLPFACGQLRASFTVLVQTEIQDDYISKVAEEKKLRGKGKSMAALQKSTPEVRTTTEPSEKAIATFSEIDEDEIKVTAILDKASQLVGLTLKRCVNTPRLLLKIIGMCVPFCPYLNTLVLHHCKLTGTLLYEIAKILPQSQITEISLDQSPIAGPGRNYYLLLETPSKLRSLSLAYCSISDADCELLFAQLDYSQPAAKILMTLNLTNNFITDTGARIIGICLRRNRTLQYLNLSGNQITDDGAAYILNSLAEFPLTADEIFKKKMRFLEYLKLKQNIYDKCYESITTSESRKTFDEFSKTSKRKAPSRGRTLSFQPISKGGSKEVIATKAHMMMEELVGHYFDPFCTDETTCRDNYIHCKGNMSLCYLNLAYNNLSFMSLIKLIQVLTYQSSLKINPGSGLLNVSIEGNNLPMCKEIYTLEDLLDNAVLSRTARLLSSKSTRERNKSKKIL